MEFSTNVDMIAVCNADGTLLPLRFRFEDGERQIRRVQVLEILSRREIRYVNVEAYEFTCRARTEEQERLMRLRYAIRTHRWSLFQRSESFLPSSDQTV
jgi:hypothetical protein